MKEGRTRDDEGGAVQCDQAQGSSFKQAIIIYLLVHLTINPINHPFIVPSLPEDHLLILSIQILISSLHHSVINRHREVKVKQADTGGQVVIVRVIGVRQKESSQFVMY